MSSAFAKFQQTKFFGSLDGLRCLSILAVITLHATSPHTDSSPLSKLGVAGVTLFFAISGFLITTLLLRERRKFGDIDLGAFYARRSLRIFPLYYSVLALYVAVVWLLERDANVRSQFFANLPSFATYTSNWFAESNSDRVIFFYAWSLATEEQFYMVWPSVEKYTKSAAPYLMVLVLSFVQLVWFEVIPTDSKGMFHRIVLSFAPAIGLGVILAHLLDHQRSFRIVHRLLGSRVAAPVALTAAVATVALQAPGLVMAFAMTALVGACCVREDHGLSRALRISVFARVGTVSYGMYLVHMLALNLARRVCERVGVHHHGAYLALCLVVAFAVAVLSFQHYESRFLKLKARFERVRAPKLVLRQPAFRSSMPQHPERKAA